MNHPAIRDVLRTVTSGSSAADADLLARFATTGDESAFELLVWRHAALVHRVCRAVLGDHHAAEDAAQAAFLVLARRAHTFAGRGAVVGWLYRIARRIAVRELKDRSRRQVISAELDHLPAPAAEPRSAPDEVAALCAEVDRLPERYRIPVLLCYFEGLTHAEAARRTGWPVGTVAGRVARARMILARRLAAKRVRMPVVVLAVAGGGFTSATVRAASLFVAAAPGGVIVPGVEPSVIRLAEGALKTMTAFAWKWTATAAAVVCAVSALTAGVWGFTAPPARPPVVPVGAEPPPESKKSAAGERVADARQRARSRNNLKEIAIAMHGYLDANGRLPQNVTDKDGKPLLSWRVELLPFLGAEDLYKQFKLDEPWDSATNKKLLAKMPDVFRVGFEPKGETKTYYQGFVGPGTVFEPDQKLTLMDIPDGTANTLAVVEAGPPVEWTRPTDIPYDPKNPLPKLEGPFSNTLIGATADGGTHAFPRDLDETSLRRMIERADGEVVSPEDLRGKFPLTTEDLKVANEVLKENEKLITAIADQLKEQQKLILELAKRPNAKDLEVVDLERLGKMSGELRIALAILQKETEELKKQLSAAPPAPKK